MQERKLLGKILVDKGLITDESLKEALLEQGETKEFLGEILIKKKFIKEVDLLGALSEQFNLPVVSLNDKYHGEYSQSDRKPQDPGRQG